MAVRISTTVVGQAIAAADGVAVEVCGLLFGSMARIEALSVAANVSADPADSFEIDPRALIAAHRAERAGGPAVIGCWHSHPAGSAVPSARDQAAAEPGRLWLIVAAGGARLWRMAGAASEEVALIVD